LAHKIFPPLRSKGIIKHWIGFKNVFGHSNNNIIENQKSKIKK